MKPVVTSLNIGGARSGIRPRGGDTAIDKRPVDSIEVRDPGPKRATVTNAWSRFPSGMSTTSVAVPVRRSRSSEWVLRPRKLAVTASC